MAKKSKKRVGRHGKDQSGCMGSLINIFDFRQGRSSQKLIQDRKRGSKRVIGTAYSEISSESPTSSCEVCEDVNDNVQGGTSSVATSKASVKELMEEEMCGDQDQKQHDGFVDEDTKQNLLVDGGYGKKIHRRARSKSSLDLDNYASVTTKDLVAQKPSHRKLKSASSVDLNVMVEELWCRIHHNDVGPLRRSQDGDIVTELIEDPSVLEEKLWEATKVLVNHFARKSLPKDGEIQPSKELVDALRILDSNKEVFLKLLQDPSSEFVKHIQGLRDIQVEEGKFKVVTGSDMLDQHLGNGKQPSFFWRRFKGHERNSSKKSGTSEVLNKIVVLKPGSPASRNIDMASNCGSLPQSPRSLSDNGQIKRISSVFSFSEFKKKLKQAMRKEHDISENGLPLPKTAIHEKKVGGEAVGLASPNRDHFFIERIPKSSVGVKKVDNTGKPKDGRINLDHDFSLSPEKRVSSIYAEAKKHLTEIVGNSDTDADTLGRLVPQPLGRIFSYSGYSSPAICSPRNQETKSRADDKACEAQENIASPKNEETTRLSSDGEDRADDKACQPLENNDMNHVNQELKINPCIDVNHLVDETNVPASEPCILDGVPREISIDKPISELEAPTTEDIVRSSDAESVKDISLMQHVNEPIYSSPSDNLRDCLSTSLIQDINNENEPSSSHSTSTLTFSMTEKNEDVDVMSDATSKPSPVSVLEPIFQEDDISPPIVKSFTAIESIQPRRICFEEQISASSKVPNNRTCVDGDKYTVEFVKAVVEMSGLTWDELWRRSLLSDHLIEPSLIDEVDFLPDLLPCDFNLLFDLIIEVLAEICQLNFTCMLSLTKPLAHPDLKGKDIFNEVWKGVEWYLKLEWVPHTLDLTITQDLAKATWMDLRPDSESVGILMQQAILDELVEDTIWNCGISLPVEAEETETTSEV